MTKADVELLVKLMNKYSEVFVGISEDKEKSTEQKIVFEGYRIGTIFNKEWLESFNSVNTSKVTSVFNALKYIELYYTEQSPTAMYGSYADYRHLIDRHMRTALALNKISDRYMVTLV